MTYFSGLIGIQKCLEINQGLLKRRLILIIVVQIMLVFFYYNKVAYL